MKLRNYYFSDADGNPVIIKSSLDGVCVCGEVYDKPGYNDGDQVCTSFLKRWDIDQVETETGSIYELVTVNSDYSEMINSLAEDIPVLSEWRLEKEVQKNKAPDPEIFIDEMLEAEHHEGIILTGRNQFGDLLKGEVINQNKNFVTLLVDEEEKLCFVNWRSFYWDTKLDIQLSRSIAGIDYDDFDNAFFMKCRPRIF